MSSSLDVETKIYRHQTEINPYALKVEEKNVRREARHSRVELIIANFLSGIAIVFKYLVSLETLLSMSLSVGFTVLGYEQTVSAFRWLCVCVCPLSFSLSLSFVVTTHSTQFTCCRCFLLSTPASCWYTYTSSFRNVILYGTAKT